MEKSEKRENFWQGGGQMNMSGNDLNVAKLSAMMCGNFAQKNNTNYTMNYCATINLLLVRNLGR